MSMREQHYSDSEPSSPDLNHRITGMAQSAAAAAFLIETSSPSGSFHLSNNNNTGESSTAPNVIVPRGRHTSQASASHHSAQLQTSESPQSSKAQFSLSQHQALSTGDHSRRQQIVALPVPLEAQSEQLPRDSVVCADISDATRVDAAIDLLANLEVAVNSIQELAIDAFAAAIAGVGCAAANPIAACGPAAAAGHADHPEHRLILGQRDPTLLAGGRRDELAALCQRTREVSQAVEALRLGPLRVPAGAAAKSSKLQEAAPFAAMHNSRLLALADGLVALSERFASTGFLMTVKSPHAAHADSASAAISRGVSGNEQPQRRWHPQLAFPQNLATHPSSMNEQSQPRGVSSSFQ
jgi:hypothetical protein